MNNIEKVLITSQMRQKAEEKAKEMGVLRNSIRNGEGNIVGFLGEMVANHVLGIQESNTYDYDLITEDGIKVDVKTKEVTSAPLPHYDCSVANFNTKQFCDYYCFVRVLNDCSCGWFLGVYKKSEYMHDAVKMHKGQIDPANNFVVKADCYNLPINKLRDKWEVLI